MDNFLWEQFWFLYAVNLTLYPEEPEVGVLDALNEILNISIIKNNLQIIE